MIQNKPFYKTEFGEAHLGDAMHLLKATPSESVDLLITSPPFALQTPKAYGNEKQDKYVDWLLTYADEIKRVLKPTGSFVLDLGGVYEKGRPVRNLYNYRVLIKMCDEFGWNLAEEFFWYNPSKLASPAEWVTKRKIRAKDSVNTVWWFSKTDNPKADTRNVLNPYSDRMQKLLDNGTKYYTPGLRPSGHDISDGFNNDNGGALPSNLLPIPNSDSNSKYFRFCRAAGVTSHPARFPLELPAFFIKFLTDENDVVLDIFGGSNTTGAAAQALNRKWLTFELNQEYLAASVMRFAEEEDDAVRAYEKLLKKTPIVKTVKAPQKAEEQPALDGLHVVYAQ
jgi:site-specific DNA-methyltransferase (cytosine-N4-specific)